MLGVSTASLAFSLGFGMWIWDGDAAAEGRGKSSGSATYWPHSFRYPKDSLSSVHQQENDHAHHTYVSRPSAQQTAAAVSSEGWNLTVHLNVKSHFTVASAIKSPQDLEGCYLKHGYVPRRTFIFLPWCSELLIIHTKDIPCGKLFSKLILRY